MNDITITLGIVNEVNVVELMRNAVIDGEDAVILGFKTFEEIQGKLEVGGCICLCWDAFVKCVNRGVTPSPNMRQLWMYLQLGISPVKKRL